MKIPDTESDVSPTSWTMKRHYEGPLDPTEQTHQVGGQNNCQNFPLFDFPKTIDPTEGSPEEDFPEEEDSPEEEEYHQEDHPEEAGDHHQCPYHKLIKGS